MTRRGEVAAKYAHSAANARVAEEARVADHAVRGVVEQEPEQEPTPRGLLHRRRARRRVRVGNPHARKPLERGVKDDPGEDEREERQAVGLRGEFGRSRRRAPGAAPASQRREHRDADGRGRPPEAPRDALEDARRGRRGARSKANAARHSSAPSSQPHARSATTPTRHAPSATLSARRRDRSNRSLSRPPVVSNAAASRLASSSRAFSNAATRFETPNEDARASEKSPPRSLSAPEEPRGAAAAPAAPRATLSNSARGAAASRAANAAASNADVHARSVGVVRDARAAPPRRTRGEGARARRRSGRRGTRGARARRERAFRRPRLSTRARSGRRRVRPRSLTSPRTALPVTTTASGARARPPHPPGAPPRRPRTRPTSLADGRGSRAGPAARKMVWSGTALARAARRASTTRETKAASEGDPGARTGTATSRRDVSTGAPTRPRPRPREHRRGRGLAEVESTGTPLRGGVHRIRAVRSRATGKRRRRRVGRRARARRPRAPPRADPRPPRRRRLRPRSRTRRVVAGARAGGFSRAFGSSRWNRLASHSASARRQNSTRASRPGVRSASSPVANASSRNGTSPNCGSSSASRPRSLPPASASASRCTAAPSFWTTKKLLCFPASPTFVFVPATSARAQGAPPTPPSRRTRGSRRPSRTWSRRTLSRRA